MKKYIIFALFIFVGMLSSCVNKVSDDVSDSNVSNPSLDSVNVDISKSGTGEDESLGNPSIAFTGIESTIEQNTGSIMIDDDELTGNNQATDLTNDKEKYDIESVEIGDKNNILLSLDYSEKFGTPIFEKLSQMDCNQGDCGDDFADSAFWGNSGNQLHKSKIVVHVYNKEWSGMYDIETDSTFRGFDKSFCTIDKEISGTDIRLCGFQQQSFTNYFLYTYEEVGQGNDTYIISTEFYLTGHLLGNIYEETMGNTGFVDMFSDVKDNFEQDGAEKFAELTKMRNELKEIGKKRGFVAYNLQGESKIDQQYREYFETLLNLVQEMFEDYGDNVEYYNEYKALVESIDYEIFEKTEPEVSETKPYKDGVYQFEYDLLDTFTDTKDVDYMGFDTSDIDEVKQIIEKGENISLIKEITNENGKKIGIYGHSDLDGGKGPFYCGADSLDCYMKDMNTGNLILIPAIWGKILSWQVISYDDNILQVKIFGSDTGMGEVHLLKIDLDKGTVQEIIKLLYENAVNVFACDGEKSENYYIFTQNPVLLKIINGTKDSIQDCDEVETTETTKGILLSGKDGFEDINNVGLDFSKAVDVGLDYESGVVSDDNNVVYLILNGSKYSIDLEKGIISKE